MLTPFDRSQYRPATVDELHARKPTDQLARLAVANGHLAETGRIGSQSDSDVAKLPAHQLLARDATAIDLAIGAWPKPQPLPHELPSVEPFTLELLPEALRPWIGDVSDRVQCPPDFPAVAGMIALGSVIGPRVGALPKRFDSWREYPNLWGAIVGRPGVLKSPALREALRPLRELESTAATNHQSAVKEWNVKQAAAAIRRRANESNALQAAKKGISFDAGTFADSDGDDEPPMRRFVVNDSSVEALGEVLRGNPNGTLLYQDELIGLLRQLERERQPRLACFLPSRVERQRAVHVRSHWPGIESSH